MKTPPTHYDDDPETEDILFDALIKDKEEDNAEIARLSKECDELREAAMPVIVVGCSQVTDEVSDLSPVEITLNAYQFRRLALALQASANADKETRG